MLSRTLLPIFLAAICVQAGYSDSSPGGGMHRSLRAPQSLRDQNKSATVQAVVKKFDSLHNELDDIKALFMQLEGNSTTNSTTNSSTNSTLQDNGGKDQSNSSTVSDTGAITNSNSTTESETPSSTSNDKVAGADGNATITSSGASSNKGEPGSDMSANGADSTNSTKVNLAANNSVTFDDLWKAFNHFKAEMNSTEAMILKLKPPASEKSGKNSTSSLDNSDKTKEDSAGTEGKNSDPASSEKTDKTKDEPGARLPGTEGKTSETTSTESSGRPNAESGGTNTTGTKDTSGKGSAGGESAEGGSGSSGGSDAPKAEAKKQWKDIMGLMEKFNSFMTTNNIF